MPYKDREKQRTAKRESARRTRAARGGGGTRGTPSVRGTQTSRTENHGQPKAADNLRRLRAHIETAEDILAVLGEQIATVRAAEVDAMEKARCIAYVCGIALRAVETADLDARLTALEKAIRGRSVG